MSARARILNAAVAMLRTERLESLNMREIASRAGVGASTLYYHFADKEDLLLTLALVGFTRLRAVLLAPAIDATVAPFNRAARDFIAFVLENPSLYELMGDQHLSSRHAAFREAEIAAAAAFGACVASDGRFPAAVTESITATFWALGRGVAITALSLPEGSAAEDFLALLGKGLDYLIDRRG